MSSPDHARPEADRRGDRHRDPRVHRRRLRAADRVPDRGRQTGMSAAPSLSTISFAFAFAIFAAVYSVGHISGCHINPAVTISLLATRKIDGRTAGGYIVAQLVGAFIGAGLTLIILTGNDPAKLGLGAVSVNANAGLAVGFAAEVIGTAILVFTVFGAAVDGQGARRLRRADHRVHRLRDHHPRRPDHRRRRSTRPARSARRSSARPDRRDAASRSISCRRLHRRPDRRRPGRRLPVRVRRPIHRTATVPGAAVAPTAAARGR